MDAKRSPWLSLPGRNVMGKAPRGMDSHQASRAVSLPDDGRVQPISDSLRDALIAKRQSFQDVVVVPQTQDRHHGGPIWPNFYRRISPRTCWGFLPVPIDRKPTCAVEPSTIVEEASWCGLIGFHYGHMIADFGMRIAQSSLLTPGIPLLFSLPAAAGFEPPPHFWQMMDVLRVPRARILLVREPIKVKTLHVFPQAERPYGAGPSPNHLDLMDQAFGEHHATEKAIPRAYVSRTKVGRGGQIAGESFLEEVLQRLGVHIIRPEDHTVPEQIALYSRTRQLIFAEGSALHTLQLIGRLGAQVVVLVRRPGQRFLRASIAPRVSSLTYLDTIDALICGREASRRIARNRGISIPDEQRVLAAFRSIGLDIQPLWNSDTFQYRRDLDIETWRDTLWSSHHNIEEAAFVRSQLEVAKINLQDRKIDLKNSHSQYCSQILTLNTNNSSNINAINYRI